MNVCVSVLCVCNLACVLLSMTNISVSVFTETHKNKHGSLAGFISNLWVSRLFLF